MRFTVQAEVTVIVEKEIGADGWEDALEKAQKLEAQDFVSPVSGGFVDCEPVKLQAVIDAE